MDKIPCVVLVYFDFESIRITLDALAVHAGRLHDRIRRSPHVIVTDGDLLVHDPSWLGEEIGVLERHPDVFACGVSLDMDNLPLATFPDAGGWVPPILADRGDYQARHGPAPHLGSLRRSEPPLHHGQARPVSRGDLATFGPLFVPSLHAVSPGMKERLVIWGASSHALVVADIIRLRASTRSSAFSTTSARNARGRSSAARPSWAARSNWTSCGGGASTI